MTSSAGASNAAHIWELVERIPLVSYIDEPGPNARGIYVSPQIRELLGYTPEEWLRERDLPSMLHPDDRERVLAEQEALFANGALRGSFEYRLIRRDGSPVWVQDDLVVVRDEDGEPLCTQGVLLDITDRKRVEERLRETAVQKERQRRFFESLLEASPTAVVTLDPDERILLWNPAAERLFEYTRAEAVGRHIDEVVRAPAEDETTPARQSLEPGELTVITKRVRKDGSVVDVEVRMAPIRAGGELEGFFAIYHDVSELQRAREQAEAATSAKSAFLATMSHEIRTPMNAVIGMTELLLDTELAAEQRNFAEVIHTSGEALLTIINDILDFSKIEAGKFVLEERAFDLRECVESALDIVAAGASEKGLDLACLIDPEAPAAVMGDGMRLRQVLCNLLMNAVKFTEQGEVVLSVELGAGDELRFSVRDTGIGIPADRMDGLFESFSQVDASTTRRYGGSGLGLAISRRLCELMGGTMWVESEVGVGSTFQFTIRAPAAPGAGRRASVEDFGELLGTRVLIVDDNAVAREVVRRQAEGWGMVTVETERPAEALDWVRAGDPFDIAVLDMQLPDMDGLTLAREIQQLRGAPGLPIVMLTSLGQRAEDRDARVELAACLTKPVKASQLHDALVRAVAGTQPAAATAAPGPAPAHGSSPLRLLVAEDNEVNRQVALLLLHKLGYTADVTANGREALDALRAKPYDVVLMDVEMPEMDGLEAARQVHREWPADSRPRIVAMTANAMQGDRERCLAAGMDDYLAKPIDRQELAAALRRSRPPGASAAEEARTPPRWLERLRELAGDDSVVAELIDGFLADAPRLLGTLDGDDPGGAHRAAHTLKSNAETFGQERLAELCQRLEDALKGSDPSSGGRSDLAGAVASEWERARAALEATRRGL